MNFFPTLKVKWQEPKSFRLASFQLLKSEVTREIRWPTLSSYSLCGAAAFAIFIWCMNRFVLPEDPMPVRFYFLGFGSFFWLIFYALPWLQHILPGYVVLYSDRIVKTHQQPQRLREISNFYWTQNENYYVLHLTSQTRVERTYGVPDTKVRDEVDAALREFGLTQSPVSAR